MGFQEIGNITVGLGALFGCCKPYGAVCCCVVSYGAVRCGLENIKKLRCGSVRFSKLVNDTVRFSIFMYCTVPFGAVLKMAKIPRCASVRLNAPNRTEPIGKTAL